MSMDRPPAGKWYCESCTARVQGDTALRRNPRRLQPIPESVLQSLEALACNKGKGDRKVRERVLLLAAR